MKYILLIFYAIIFTGTLHCAEPGDSTLLLSSRQLTSGVHYVINQPPKTAITPVDPATSYLDYPLLGSLGLLYGGSAALLHNYQADAWWKNSTEFYFHNNWNKDLNFNKFGQFYAVNLLGHIFSGAYEAAGMQALPSTWYSSLSALAYMLYIETEDGFHKDNGFSLTDASADLAGTLFYIGQYYYPVMKNFMPKVSYYPSVYISSRNNIVFDDYYGQKYWMSVRIKNFLPGESVKYWPGFLNIAAGAGLNKGERKNNLEFYIALDLDAEELPLYGPFWQFFKNTLNYFHFPMPGVRITPDAAFFMFCF